MGACFSQKQFEEYCLDSHIGAWTWQDQSTLIRSGFSDFLSRPVRAKVGFCRAFNCFDCWITDRIPSSSIIGHHLWPKSSLIWGGGVLSLCRGAVCIFYSLSQHGSFHFIKNCFEYIYLWMIQFMIKLEIEALN